MVPVHPQPLTQTARESVVSRQFWGLGCFWMQASLCSLSHTGAAIRMQEIFSPKAVLESYMFRLKEKVWFEEIFTNQEGLRVSGVSARCDSKLSDLRQVPLCLGSRPGRLSFDGMFPGKREKPIKRGKQVIDYLDFFFFFCPEAYIQFSTLIYKTLGENRKPPTAKIQVRELNDEPPRGKTQLVEFGAILETWLNHDFLCPWYCFHLKTARRCFLSTYIVSNAFSYDTHFYF